MQLTEEGDHFYETESNAGTSSRTYLLSDREDDMSSCGGDGGGCQGQNEGPPGTSKSSEEVGACKGDEDMMMCPRCARSFCEQFIFTLLFAKFICESNCDITDPDFLSNLQHPPTLPTPNPLRSGLKSSIFWTTSNANFVKIGPNFSEMASTGVSHK